MRLPMLRTTTAALVAAAVTTASLLGTTPVPHAGSLAQAAATHDGRPNVVVLLVDDATVRDVMDKRVMPEAARWLVERGVSFSTSYAPFPLCCPARASLLTGQYAHNHGVLDNSGPWGGIQAFQDQSSLGTWLQGAGYSTAYVGKYLNGYASQPRYVPPGWERWVGVARGIHDYYGARLNIDGRLRSVAGRYQTDVLSQRARAYVAEEAPAEPFLLFASFLAPHHGSPQEFDDPPVVYGLPIVTPAVEDDYRDVFAGEQLPRSAAFDERNISDKPAKIARRPRLSADEIRAITEAYQQRQESLRSVDDGIGRIMAALRDSGELSNTYVILTSDNGYLQGEHRVRSGKILPYEPSARVPLVVRGPGIPAGAVRAQPVAAIDVVPTIIDLAEAGDQLGGFVMDGRSLLPKIAYPQYGDDRDLVLEAGPRGRTFNYRYHGLRTSDGWKYVEYNTGERELYNLRKDPQELHNLAYQGAYARQRADLRKRLDELKFCAGSDCP